MSNALDYLEWRGDLTFNLSPFNEVDIFLLSMLSCPNYSCILTSPNLSIDIEELSIKYFDFIKNDKKPLGVLQSKYAIPMLKVLPSTERFKSVKIAYSVDKISENEIEQFSAVTAILPDGSLCLSFQGTDDTLIGWKEDFQLATKDTVPAQIDALNYLTYVANNSDGPIYLCGHSKGGNLALYAALNAPEKIQNRIVKAYSFDGPGFNLYTIKDTLYYKVKDKLVTVLSQNSLIGTLLTPVGDLRYVISEKSGPVAHDGFTWKVKGTKFEDGYGLSDVSKAFKETMEDTLSTLSNDEKQSFVDDFFDILMSTGAETVTELTDIKWSDFISIFKDISKDKDISRFSSVMFTSMFHVIQENIPGINHLIRKNKE